MGDSKNKIYKAEVKVEENEDKQLVTVKDFIELLKSIDQDAVISILPDSDYDEEECTITLEKLKESLHILKEDYLFIDKESLDKDHDKQSKNYLVIDAFNFGNW